MDEQRAAEKAAREKVAQLEAEAKRANARRRNAMAYGLKHAHSERNIRIYEMRQAGATLEAVGAEFGVTHERVRQIVLKVERRLAQKRMIENRATAAETLRLDELPLSAQAANALREEGLVCIGDLVATTEIDLRCIPNFGKVSLKEVKEMLGQLGLRLGMAGAPDAAE